MVNRMGQSMVMGFTAVVLALTGCAVEGNPAKEVVSQEAQELIITNPAPRCTYQNTTWTHAHKHTAASGEAGYTRAFPNNLGDAIIDPYEKQVWNIPHANGYEYLVDNVFWKGPCAPGIASTCAPTEGTPQVYLVGILDGAASPPYNTSAPDPAAVRYPWPLGALQATAYDFNTERALATNASTAAPSHAPLNSSYGNCVGILDEGGNIINYFVLTDIHDPNGHNW